MATLNAGEERFDFGRVTGRIFNLIGRNFTSFFFMALVFTGLPSIVINVIVTSASVDAGTFLATVTLLIFSTLLQGALTRASLDDLSGKVVSAQAALGTSFTRFLPLLGLGILVYLGVIVGLILLIIPGVILILRWMVCAPALVAEGIGISKAMARSAELTDGHRWPIFGLTIIYFIIVLVLNSMADALTAGLGGSASTAGLIIRTANDAFQSMIVTVGAASIYFELREIKEGVSVGEIAAVFE
jgi:hypothetical protein